MTRNFDFSQAANNGVMVFPDLSGAPPPVDQVLAATGINPDGSVQLGFVNPSAGTGGVPEAPVNNTSVYGRGNLAWAPVLPLTGGTMSGPLNVTATGSITPRSAQDRFAEHANVLDFGGDPSGNLASDNATAINAAAAASPSRTVYLPAGTYHIKRAINVGGAGFAQRLLGDGAATIIDVGGDFDPAATGVVIINGTAAPHAAAYASQPAVEHLRIRLKQPPDATTTASAASSGATSLTVASAANIQVGHYVVDVTNYTSATHPTGNYITVSAIAGNVLTLSRGLFGNVVAGDQMAFGPTRAMYKTLAAGGTTTTGGTGVQYPWAIYNNGYQSLRLDNVVIEGAWGGVYTRGDQLSVSTLIVGAMNVGLDFDQCYNFPYIGFYSFSSYGFGYLSASDQGYARNQAFFDGATVAANLGQGDSLDIGCFATFSGRLNITANFSWGEIGTLALDGTGAKLNVVSTNGNGWLQIGSLYATSQAATGTLLTVNANAGFSTQIGNAQIGAGANTALSVAASRVTINQGIIYSAAASPGVVLSGGDLTLGPVKLIGTSIPFVSQTGGVLRAFGAHFDGAAGGSVGIAITDVAANQVHNIALNGWTFSGIPATPLGSYDGYLPATTMTGPLVTPSATISGGTINNTAIGGTTPAAGTFAALAASGGLNLGSTVGGGATDLSHHITLYSPGYGINATPNTINFVVSGTAVADVNSAGVAVLVGALGQPTQGGIVAAGTTQGTATALTAPICNVGTVASGTGVILPSAPPMGARWVIWNHGANPLSIYPASGHTIFSLAPNAPTTLATNARVSLIYWGGLWIPE